MAFLILHPSLRFFTLVLLVSSHHLLSATTIHMCLHKFMIATARSFKIRDVSMATVLSDWHITSFSRYFRNIKIITFLHVADLHWIRRLYYLLQTWNNASIYTCSLYSVLGHNLEAHKVRFKQKCSMYNRVHTHYLSYYFGLYCSMYFLHVLNFVHSYPKHKHSERLFLWTI